MTGAIEIVGLVLGTFPIVISVLESYEKEVLKTGSVSDGNLPILSMTSNESTFSSGSK